MSKRTHQFGALFVVALLLLLSGLAVGRGQAAVVGPPSGLAWPIPDDVGATRATTLVNNCSPNVVNYDLVYVRAPRYGDSDNSSWPDTTRPMNPDPGADLRLLHPNCTEEVLFPLPIHQSIVDAPIGNGAVSDPNISFDGQWVVFAYYHDQADINPQRGHSYMGADIYRLNLLSRQVVRLTYQAFTPNTGNGANFDCSQPQTNCPQMGAFNIGPAFVAQSDPARPAIIFTSTRNDFVPPKPFGNGGHVLQLFSMDWDGQNVSQIGYLNQARALHPFQLADGRLMFTSWENQGIRDDRQFNLWFIGPDGTQWASGSGFGENAIGHHFMTQMSNSDIVAVRYYNFNNNGFGDLARFPLDLPGPDFLPITGTNTYMPFERPAQIDLTNWAENPYDMAGDFPAPCTVGNNIYNDSGVTCAGGNATRIGKVTHPAVAPGDDVLLVYTSGPANHNGIHVGQGTALPFYDGGLYLMNSDQAADGSALPGDLIRIVNDPAYNEQWPRPVVPYASLFTGLNQPAVWPDLANNGDAAPAHGLPANSPFGLVGTSSLIWRDTEPRPGVYGGDPDPFNASHEALYAWIHQGADAGLYTSNVVYAIRLLALIPSTDRRYPNNGQNFFNYANERLRILGEIPVRHEGVIDLNGNTDTSFLARIPADVPFTFQTLDRNGMVLNMAQTWHQVRPGEVRYDCGGCHAHTKAPLDFNTTVAGQPGFQPIDVALQTPLLQITQLNGNPATITATATFTDVEYFRDVRPILTARCAGCHTNDVSDGALNLHDDGNLINGWPGTYYRLALDWDADYGLGVPPDAAETNYFIGPQMTRYLRGFQARESLLIWKVFGARLDGRANATRIGDIDFTPDAIHTNALTWDEKLTLVRWADLGAPIETDAYWGWFEDDLRSTLWAAPTLVQARLGSVNSVVVGAYDLESGLIADSLSVTFNIPIGAQPAGTNFAAGLNLSNGGVLTVPLPAAVDLVTSSATLTVTIKDNAGHTTSIVRTFTGLAQTSFSAPLYLAAKTVSTFSVPVRLSATLPVTTTVDYATAPGTALAGVDYITATGTLTFAPGVTSQLIPLTILDNPANTNGHTLTVTLSNVTGTGAALGAPNPTTVLIVPEVFWVYLPVARR